MHRLTGTKAMTCITRWTHIISGRKGTLWNPLMPDCRAVDSFAISAGKGDQVVYFRPVSTGDGKSADHGPDQALSRKTSTALQKAGFEVLQPENLDDCAAVWHLTAKV
jgi:hypothetical protein